MNAPITTHDLEVHPLATLFPLMETDEFKVFKEDISKRKQQQPIVLYGGKILDGRNRYNACKGLGMTPITKPYEGNDPLGFVLSANLHRRHLKESQRAMVAAKLVTTKLGDNQHIQKEGRSIDQPTAAKMLNVSAKSVQRASNVREKCSPEIIAAVETGKIAVSLAEKVAEKFTDKAKQAELATKPNKIREAVTADEEVSDNLDDVENAYVEKLQELKSRKPENAEAAVANLVKRLQDMGYKETLKK